MRKRNKRKEKEARDEEEKKKAEAQRKAIEKQNLKDIRVSLFAKTPPTKPPIAAKTKRENNRSLLYLVNFL